MAGYFDVLGFSEISEKTDVSEGGIANMQLNGFFRNERMYNEYLRTTQSNLNGLKSLNLSDSVLLYQEVSNPDDFEELSRIVEQVILGIAFRQDTLLGTNGLLTRGYVDIGLASLGKIAGVYAGPLLAHLVKNERKFPIPVVGVSERVLKMFEMKRSKTIREKAYRIGEIKAEIQRYSNDKNYIDYFQNFENLTPFLHRRIKSICAHGVDGLRHSSLSVRKKWLWIMDRFLDLNLRALDNRGSSFENVLNEFLREPYKEVKARIEEEVRVQKTLEERGETEIPLEST